MKLFKRILGILVFVAAFVGAVSLLMDKTKEQYVEIERDSDIYY